MEEEYTNFQAPLAELQEDLEDQEFVEIDRRLYLPDDLYWFKRPDFGRSLLERRSTYFLCDDDYKVVKRAVLNIENVDQDLNKTPLAVTVVDHQTGNVDYRLERNLKALGCCKPFRKAELKIKSDNGIDLFTMTETKRNKTFTFYGLTGELFRVHRDPANNKLFSILDGPARLGTIEKSWEQLYGMPTMDGHYHIKFNENAADLKDEVKYLVLLGTFLLDFLFYVPPRKQDRREEYKDYQDQPTRQNNSPCCDALCCAWLGLALSSF